MVEKFNSNVPNPQREGAVTDDRGDLDVEQVGTIVDLETNQAQTDVMLDDDGSAVVNPEEAITQPDGFMANLAEILPEDYMEELASDLAETIAEIQRIPKAIVAIVRRDKLLRRIWPCNTPVLAIMIRAKARNGEAMR